MADTWSGPTATVGVLTYAYNSDNTAIRFSRSDNGPFPAGLGDALTKQLAANLREAAEVLELAASKLDFVDSAFAGNCRTRASAYRTAGNVTVP